MKPIPFMCRTVYRWVIVSVSQSVAAIEIEVEVDRTHEEKQTGRAATLSDRSADRQIDRIW